MDEQFEWNVQSECHLLESMIGHKPIGVNKWFQMLLIYDKFVEKVDKELVSLMVWNHLETMYNIEALDESESIPFPNDETDFDLPDFEYSTMKEQKIEEKKNVQKGRETPKNLKEVTKRDDKTPVRNIKEVQRRDSKDSRSSTSSKKEVKKDLEKPSKPKGRTSSFSSKDDSVKPGVKKSEETGRPAKRPTRGSLKPEDANSSGKASPVSSGAGGGLKRRRVVQL